MPAPASVTSRQHPFVRRCRALADRRDPDAVLLDGEHVVSEALEAGLIIDAVLTDDRPRALTAQLSARHVTHLVGSAAVVSAASPVRTSSGVVAIARWTPADVPDVLASPEALVIGLINVQDPGNTGSVVRSADALGATGVLALDGTADPGGWKALRGAMGSTFHLPVAVGRSIDALAVARDRGVTVAAAVAQGGTAIDQLRLTPPLLLLVGNEGRGLDDAVLASADLRVRLPMRPGVESLNVAVSAALLIWEARRTARIGTVR